MKKTRRKKAEIFLDKIARKIVKRLRIKPAEHFTKKIKDEFFVFNKKSGYYEPMK